MYVSLPRKCIFAPGRGCAYVISVIFDRVKWIVLSPRAARENGATLRFPRSRCDIAAILSAGEARPLRNPMGTGWLWEGVRSAPVSPLRLQPDLGFLQIKVPCKGTNPAGSRAQSSAGGAWTVRLWSVSQRGMPWAKKSLQRGFLFQREEELATWRAGRWDPVRETQDPGLAGEKVTWGGSHRAALEDV